MHGHLRDRQPIDLGPFTVTPHLVDHSGFDAYALLIDADSQLDRQHDGGWWEL